MKEETNLWTVLIILFIHFVADFIVQTDEQAKGKSKNLKDLLVHTVTYSFVFLPFTFFVWHGYANTMYFIIITFVSHTAQDYVTSRVNSRLYKQQKNHLFFIGIGFDQFLHFCQLLLTYQLLR